MLQNILRLAAQDQACHTTLPMRAENDAVHLFALGCIEYDHGDRVRRFNYLTPSGHTLR